MENISTSQINMIWSAIDRAYKTKEEYEKQEREKAK